MYDHNRIKNHVKGVESNSYELFGAHIEGSGVFFSVYAPAASKVCLIADFDGWNDIPMDRDMLGVWSIFVTTRKMICQKKEFPREVSSK